MRFGKVATFFPDPHRSRLMAVMSNFLRSDSCFIPKIFAKWMEEVAEKTKRKRKKIFSASSEVRISGLKHRVSQYLKYLFFQMS